MTYFERAADALFRAAAEEIGVVPAVMRARRGPSRVARARQAVWYVLHHRVAGGLERIAAFTGHDRSSVSHGVSTTGERIRGHDEDTQALVTVLIRALPADEAVDERRSEAMALLEACEALAGNVEAIGHSLAAAGERLADLCAEIRLSISNVDAIERGAA